MLSVAEQSRNTLSANGLLEVAHPVSSPRLASPAARLSGLKSDSAKADRDGSADAEAPGRASRTWRPRTVTLVESIEPMEDRRALHNDDSGIDRWTRPWRAIRPGVITPGIHCRHGNSSVLRGRRLTGAKFGGALEQPDPFGEHVDLGLPGRIRDSGSCSGSRGAIGYDIDDASTRGRSQIAVDNRSRRIDPCIDVRVSARQPEHTRKRQRESQPQEMHRHFRGPRPSLVMIAGRDRNTKNCCRSGHPGSGEGEVRVRSKSILIQVDSGPVVAEARIAAASVRFKSEAFIQLSRLAPAMV